MSTQDYELVTRDTHGLIDSAPVSEDRYQIKRIFQGNGGKLIRISFQPGQVMREHTANAPIFVQVLEGEIVFRVSDKEIVMPAGAIIHVEKQVTHELEARTEAHVLLTLCV